MHEFHPPSTTVNSLHDGGASEALPASELVYYFDNEVVSTLDLTVHHHVKQWLLLGHYLYPLISFILHVSASSSSPASSWVYPSLKIG